jgi:NADP-dependent 3-hydroxy acid dehydrogenase YdfG
VVTGASSGIGRATALGLARAGGRVWAVGRNRGRLDALGAEAGHEGAIVTVVADLENDDELRSIASSVLAETDRVDVLVHSAGAIAIGPLEAVTAADLDREYRVNLRAPYELTRALLPALRRAQGQLVFVNSSAALRASANNASYAATKAGLKALADAVRADVNRDGVRVLTLYVGRTATPMQETVHEHEGKPYRPELLLRPEDVAEVVVSSLSMPRSGEVTDLSIRPLSKPVEELP